MWCPCCLPQDPANMYCVRILRGNRGCLDFGETFVSAQWNLEGFLCPLKWPSEIWTWILEKLSSRHNGIWRVFSAPYSGHLHTSDVPAWNAVHKNSEQNFRTWHGICKMSHRREKSFFRNLKNSSPHRMLNWTELDVTWNNLTSLSLAYLNWL